MIRSFVLGAACAAALMGAISPATASVVMNATRYVYPADASEITVKVSNAGKTPVLVQAWLDDGDATATPETVDVPFNLTPPISRIEVGKSQMLRINFTEGDLPQDIESMFWLNVLEVPPKADNAAANSLQLALRYRLKVFYRPNHLKGTPDAASSGLTWARHGKALTVRNDSAYHVAVNHVSMAQAGHSHTLVPVSLEPHSFHEFKPEGYAVEAGEASVHFQTINDYGGFVEHDAAIAP